MHYDEQYMVNMLSEAYAGQPKARQSLQNIEPLHAFYDHAEEPYYAGDAEWHGNRIHIMLHAGDREEAESMLPGVEQLLDNLNTLDEQARQSFAAELLDIWNEHWLDEYLQEEPYTAAQFASHLKLRELEWEQDRQVCMYYSNTADLSFSVSLHADHGFHSHQIG